jgi:hypothetical protein
MQTDPRLIAPESRRTGKLAGSNRLPSPNPISDLARDAGFTGPAPGADAPAVDIRE